MGVRTIFNILGPLTNPAGAQRQLMGIFAADLTDMVAHVLGKLGSKSAMVVSGYGGLDELTTTGPNHVSHYKEGTVRTYEFDPRDYGFPGANIADLLGDEAPLNARILKDILSGELRDAKRDVVVLNAGAALLAAGIVDDLEVGIQRAAEIIDSGAALAKLESLVAYSQKFTAVTN
jgi:anthranilate phosphoribosyltransferase